MLRIASRSASFIPKDPIVFPPEGPKLLYSYEGYKADKKLMKYILGFSTCTSLLWGVEFAMTKKVLNIFFTPFKLGLLAALYPLVFIRLNSTRIVKLSLEADGKTAHAVIDEDSKNRVVKFDAEKASWTKNGENFILTAEGKRFFLDQDGKIHDLQAFYAILRSLSVDKEFIKQDGN